MANTVADYSGRTIDLLVFQSEDNTAQGQLEIVLAQEGQSGQVVTGVEKLVQRFLLEFLTEQGSMRYNPSRGCLFFYEARTGYFRTSADIQGAFARAVSLISENILADETSEDPDDERFENAELLNVALNSGEANLQIQITSRAGANRILIYPLSITV